MDIKDQVTHIGVSQELHDQLLEAIIAKAEQKLEDELLAPFLPLTTISTNVKNKSKPFFINYTKRNHHD